MKHPMNRAERRGVTEQIAWYRAGLYHQTQFLGWFRKWNLTCQCSLCQMEKYDDIRLQRMKDDRRNGEFEEVGL